MEDTCRLYVFGTGNATVTRCYNTCFAIRRGDEYFMTDAGGGNGILSILEQMEEIDEQIQRWQDKMSDQVDYYTSQFTRLEMLINQMNSQSSALAGLMGGY